MFGAKCGNLSLTLKGTKETFVSLVNHFPRTQIPNTCTPFDLKADYWSLRTCATLVSFVLEGYFSLKLAIGHFEVEQGTGSSCQLYQIYKITPSYERPL